MKLSLPLVASLLSPIQALYFYIDGQTPKCFFEELPKDTLVVGHYTAEEYDNEKKSWDKHDGLSIAITVDVRLPLFLPFPLAHPHLPILTPPTLNETTLLTSTTGSIRRQPPSNNPTGQLLGPLHLHRRRQRRPQDLFHAIVHIRGIRLALGAAPTGRDQVDAGSGDRGDEQDREYG